MKKIPGGQDTFAISKTDGRRAPLPPSTLLPKDAQAILAEAARAPINLRVRRVAAAHERVRRMYPNLFNDKG